MKKHETIFGFSSAVIILDIWRRRKDGYCSLFVDESVYVLNHMVCSGGQ